MNLQDEIAAAQANLASLEAKQASESITTGSSKTGETSSVEQPTNISTGAVNQVNTPVDPSVAPVTNVATTPSPDLTQTTEHNNTVPLSNDVTPRSSTQNESTNPLGINSNTEVTPMAYNEEGLKTASDLSYQDKPQTDVSNQVSEEISKLFPSIKERTGKEVQVFNYNSETKKADVRIEGYNARQTQQVLNSVSEITSIGRDDFRDVVRIGTDPTPIRDLYAFDINGNRVVYFE